MQSDERLSELFNRGVDPAFDELVRRYRGPLTTFAGGIVGRDRAEDVVQDSLVKAHRSMASGEIREPRAWLYKVVRNTALNEIRDGSRHEHDELNEWGVAGTGNQAADEAERREELAMLISALAELPESQRTALVGRELGGYSHDELAEKLGVSRGATKQLIFRARTGLRNALGALLPMPLIVWLASDATGTFVASGTGTAAAAGAAGVAGGAGGATGATGAVAGGGLLAGLAGGGAAKVAVVAAVAGGTVAAGVAVEERTDSDSANRPAVVRTIERQGPAGIASRLVLTAGNPGSTADTRASRTEDWESSGPAGATGRTGTDPSSGSDEAALAAPRPGGGERPAFVDDQRPTPPGPQGERGPATGLLPGAAAGRPRPVTVPGSAGRPGGDSGAGSDAGSFGPASSRPPGGGKGSPGRPSITPPASSSAGRPGAGPSTAPPVTRPSAPSSSGNPGKSAAASPGPPSTRPQGKGLSGRSPRG